MRILFVKSRSLGSKVTASTPPLGLMYLSSWVKQQLGAETRILDVKFCHDPRQAVIDAVRDFNPDVVGISGLTAEAYLLHEAARLARTIRPDVPIIAGGPHATSDPDDVLANPAIDAAVIGEGEITLVELLRAIDGAGPGWTDPAGLSTIRGIAYRDADGRTVRSEPRPFIDNLDELPFPDWNAVEIKRFWKHPPMSTLGIRPYVPMFTSRGCPFHCTYCHNVFGKKFRARSPENVIAEIKEIRRLYGEVDLEILDDISNLRRDRLNGIFLGLLADDMHPRISFPNAVRTDLLDRETIELLARVGAGEISVAVETASERLQKLIRKDLDLDKVRQNIEIMVDNRIFTRGFFMLGFPTETMEEMRSTVKFATDSRLHLALFFAVNPFRDTAMYEEFRRLGKVPAEATHGDFEYFGAPFNGSELTDSQFRRIYKHAYYRFYFDPVRVARIVRDRPYWGDIPHRVGMLFRNLTSFRKVDDAGTEDWHPDRW